MFATLRTLAALVAVVTLQGCAAALSPIGNEPGFPYAPEKLETSSLAAAGPAAATTSWSGSVPVCTPGPHDLVSAASPSAAARNDARAFPLNVRLSRGDRVSLSMLNGDEFNGDYVIGPDGKIGIPHMPRQLAATLTEDELARRLDKAFASANLMEADAARTSIRVVKYAAIQISVAGAVFQPGFLTINEPGADKTHIPDTVRVYGDTTMNRNLSAALREASGVRPDADVNNIQVIRRGRTYHFDFSGAITGQLLLDPALEDGDQIIVPSAGCFQTALVRPSIITPRGIRIYVSKIHIGPDARYDEKIPFGLRLLQGAIIASCAGGNLATEGRRQIVLVSTNPITGRTEVVQRSVEQLVRDQNRDEINPMLMPDDAIACYDSTVKEAIGIAGAAGSIANSISAIVNAQRLLNGQ